MRIGLLRRGRGSGKGEVCREVGRWPLTLSVPDSQAPSQVSAPVATASQVWASVSTTLGGVPRVWVVPVMHWTAPNGGTRTSTLRPGATTESSSSV